MSAQTCPRRCGSRWLRRNLRCNAEIPVSVLRATCKLDSLGERTLAELVERHRTVTARSVDRLIKVARTVADLFGQDIDAGCLLEAAGARDVDRSPTSSPGWRNAVPSFDHEFLVDLFRNDGTLAVELLETCWLR